MLPRHFLKLRVALVLGLLLTLPALHAQEQQFAEQNCAFTPPEGWKPIHPATPQPGVVAIFANADRTRLVLLVVDRHEKIYAPLSDTFVAGFDRGVEHGGGNRLWGKFIQLDGFPTYERLGSVTRGTKQLSVLMEVVPVSNGVFSMQGIRLNGDASADPDLQKSLASFHFLTRPQPALGLPPGASAAFRTGFLIAKYTMPLLMLAGVVAVLFVVVAITVRSASNRPVRPPPIPGTKLRPPQEPY